jgi:adenylosuccinate synthase
MSNDKGTWFGWEVSKVGPVQDQGVYGIAKSFAEQVGKGAVEVKHESQEETKKSLNL